MQIAIVNGPNLERVGTREPEIYGTVSLPAYLAQLQREYAPKGVEVSLFFSNHEGALIDELYRCSDCGAAGIILNAGAYTHTSLALADCLRALQLPVVEVHLSNIFAREQMRRTSLLTPYCRALIAGAGVTGYRLALQYLCSL